MKKRILSFVLVVCMLLAPLHPAALSAAATTLPNSLYLTQATSYTCTLCSAAMMLRARMYLSGNADWESITEEGIAPIAWNSGLRWSFTYQINESRMTVAHATVGGGMTETELKAVLDAHPEGIVLYVRDLPHAVFLTDYDGDTFYCAETLDNYGKMRIPLASSSLGRRLGGQAAVLHAMDDYWYVASYSIPATPVDQPPVIRDVKILSIDANGYTVSCTVTDDTGVSRVQFPTWTQPEQDDLAENWAVNSAYSGVRDGDTYTYRVNIAAHNNETARYVTQIHAWDLSGNASSVSVEEVTVSYPVRYNANGGSGAPEPQTKVHGKALALSTVQPVREGYVFFGWSEDPAALIPSYFAGAEFTTDANTELFAVWREIGSAEPASVVARIYGETRYETSLKIADAVKAKLGVDKFSNIIVASGAGFADALAGSYLAKVKDAPILMAQAKGKNVNDLKNYIAENLVPGGMVYILGGVNAVPAALDTALSGYNVKRLAGEDRYETNLLILKEAGVTNEEILVCKAQDFADSLSASAVGKPILLVNSNTSKLTDMQKAYLAELSTDKFYIIGGENAVNSTLENAIKAYGSVERIAGENRYETSVKVAQKFFSRPNAAVLAYARNFPDGLCGGPLALAMDAPLILTKTDAQLYAKAYAQEKGIVSGSVLGGAGLIDDPTAKDIFGAEIITVT